MLSESRQSLLAFRSGLLTVSMISVPSPHVRVADLPGCRSIDRLFLAEPDWMISTH